MENCSPGTVGMCERNRSDTKDDARAGRVGGIQECN